MLATAFWIIVVVALLFVAGWLFAAVLRWFV